MTAQIEQTAQAMVADGKGILAADESTGTIKKRFDSIGAQSTEDNRRDYREMLFRATDGAFVRRLTLAHGWPAKRPAEFGPDLYARRRRAELVDPGVVASRRTHSVPGERDKTPLQIAAEATFGGRTFRAMQPALYDLQREVGWKDMREKLRRLNETVAGRSALEAAQAAA